MTNKETEQRSLASELFELETTFDGSFKYGDAKRVKELVEEILVEEELEHGPITIHDDNTNWPLRVSEEDMARPESVGGTVRVSNRNYKSLQSIPTYVDVATPRSIQRNTVTIIPSTPTQGMGTGIMTNKSSAYARLLASATSPKSYEELFDFAGLATGDANTDIYFAALAVPNPIQLDTLTDTFFDKYVELLRHGVFEVLYNESETHVLFRPSQMKVDDQNRLHCADGPALTWKTGKGEYYWHGVMVPENVIEDPNSIKSDEVLLTPNIEQRRALVEIIGYERLLAAVDHKVLDEDVDGGGKERRLIKIPVPDARDNPTLEWGRIQDEHIVLVEVNCPSTAHKYFLRVPPNITTCAQAVAWTYAETAETYAPLKEA